MRSIRSSVNGLSLVAAPVSHGILGAVAVLGVLVAVAGAGVVEGFFRFRVDVVVEQNVIDLSGDEADVPRMQTVALADVNGDATVDLLTVDYDGEEVTVRLGRGDATFGDASSVPAGDLDGSSYSPVAIVVEDFTSLFSDGGGPDGKPDIAIIGDNGEIFIAIGDGNGGFAAPDQEVDESLELFFPTGAVSGNFDGDDAPDIAVADDDLIIVFCNSAGTFELCPGGVIDLNDVSSDFPLIFDIVSGDFDGDGNGDIAALSPEEGAVYVAFGDGAGSFVFDIPILLPLSALTGGLAVGSMNGDDIDDIIVALPGPFGDNAQVSLGSGNRAFQTLPFVAPETTTAIEVGPFDRDALDDVIFSDDSNLWVIAGNGTGDFGDNLGAFPATEVGIGGRRGVNAFTLVAADLDNDSLLDIVGLVSSGTEIEVAVNVVDQPTQTPTALASATPEPTASEPVDTPTAGPTAATTPSQPAPPTSTAGAPTRTREATRPPQARDDDSCAVAPVRSAGWANGIALGLVALVFSSVSRRRR